MANMSSEYKSRKERILEKELAERGTLTINKPVEPEVNDDRTRFAPTRDEDRVSREVDTRSRASIFDMPDYDNIDLASTIGTYQLMAPPPRVHPKWGKMRQYWANKTMNNGRRVFDMIRQGWVVRHPDTVDRNFPFATEQWEGNGVIGVANTHILMEIPEFHYKKLENELLKENNSRINQIRGNHGKVMRDGVYQDEKMHDVGSFSRDVEVARENGERSVNFAD